MLRNYTRQLSNTLPAAGLALALVGCGGDTSSPAVSDQPLGQASGTVGILLTDKPADPDLFSAVNATIARIELLRDDDDDDDAKVVVYSGDPQTVNLLRLKHESIPFSFREDVPAGEYCKVRLILDDLELVLADDTPADDMDNERHHPRLPGNGKLDLVVRDCFRVAANQVTTLQLDLDAGNSIHINRTGQGFNFRPVAFVDVIKHQFDGKLIRLNGQIDAVNPGDNNLRLCGALPVFQSETRQCTRIQLGEAAAFFDNQQHGGAPRPLSELLDATMVGQSVTVVGRPHVPETPQGLLGEADPAWLEVTALAVEYGDFIQLQGTAAGNADPEGFEAALEPGPVAVDGNLSVALQTGAPGVNGTRIVAKTGELLEPTQIIAGRPVSLDGVLQIGTDSEATLRAALVIVDTAAVSGGLPLSGTVLTPQAGGFTLSPTAAACGFVGDLLVRTDDDTDILTVSIDTEGSVIDPGGEIASGQDVTVTGVCENGAFSAATVIILNDSRN